MIKKFRAWDEKNKMMLVYNPEYMTKGEWFRMCERRGLTNFEQFIGNIHERTEDVE